MTGKKPTQLLCDGVSRNRNVSLEDKPFRQALTRLFHSETVSQA